MKRLWIELQRWDNSRAVICRQCGTIRRVRTGLSGLAAAHHTQAKAGHTVKVRRFG